VAALLAFAQHGKALLFTTGVVNTRKRASS